ncbi:hypothetical protein CARUB_v10025363mg [Capsella rubella]|uniref:Uncharacterized protein n=1 Tax=Capsella rubella TaxID=81985 RepID=R0G1I4_9BRAS|nr:hypothetical protein CARUB_v10025363mg [Capsella rubella]
MAKGVHAIGFITYLVIFLILTGISRGRTAYVSPGPCSDSLCTQDCTLDGVYSKGKCAIEKSKPVCKCYGCKKA